MPRLPILLMLAQAVGSAQGLDQTLDMLLRVHEFKETAISPDGTKVAFVEGLKARDLSASSNSAIYLRERTKGPPRQITVGDGAPASEHDVAWSPDGSQIAFVSDAAKKGQLQLYVAPVGGGRPRKLTNSTGFLANPKWSPDGKQLAFLFIENALRAPGPLEAVTPFLGVVDEHIYTQRIALVDLVSGRVRQLSPADIYVYEYDWSPDGRHLAYTGAPGPGDNNWYIARLFTIDAASSSVRTILEPRMQIALPRWSPDSRNIAYIGGLMSDEGSVGGEVFSIPADGGEPRNLTPKRKSSPAWIRWLPSSKHLLVTENVQGGSAISTLDPATGHMETLWRGDETIFTNTERVSVSVAGDERTFSAIRSSWSEPPEVWAGRPGEWTALTSANRGSRRTWGEARSIQWKSDGFVVQGWVVYPAGFDPKKPDPKRTDPNKRYPMIVLVHGGPSNLTKPVWPGTLRYDPTILSSLGYFVLLPNPRGSFGQGEEFTRANVKDFGYGDLRDILAGCDEVVRTLPVDDERIGITGWSYGGYITMWAVTQTQRFHAAVAGAGLANLQSYYGQNQIDQWLIPFFGASVYDDPAVYAKSSPIAFIKNVKTPTLVVVGERDGESPSSQSLEYWHALKTLGTKTQLIVYPGEGHRFHKPEDMRDVLQRAVKWFEQN